MNPVQAHSMVMNGGGLCEGERFMGKEPATKTTWKAMSGGDKVNLTPFRKLFLFLSLPLTHTHTSRQLTALIQTRLKKSSKKKGQEKLE